MSSIKLKACALLLTVSAIGMTGCGGESILSAASKVVGGQISTLTPGEIQILNQTAIDIVASQNVGYTASVVTLPQAAALVEFFKDNSINTVDDLMKLADTAQANPDAVEGYDDLAEAFQGSEYDQGDDFDASGLSDLFGSVIGGAV